MGNRSGDESLTWSFEMTEPVKAGGSTATGGRVIAFRSLLNGGPVTRFEFFESLASSASCRAALTRCLVDLPSEQIYWETPALTSQTADAQFEFVAVSASLSTKASSTAFQPFFVPNRLTVSFPNLGGDAILVVPVEHQDETQYNYLLSFLRTGTHSQINAVWEALGSAVLAHISDTPMWVSTSGGGVPWLHFRLDSAPKYYSHAPYRLPPA